MIEKDEELKRLLRKELNKCDAELHIIAKNIAELKARQEEVEKRKSVLDEFKWTIYG